MVFNIIGGSSFSVGTLINNFKTSLLTKGILHISVTGTVIFNFSNMAATSMFNWISSSIEVGFGRNSWTGGEGGGTTLSVDGKGASTYGCSRVEGCDGGIEVLFFLAYVKISFFINSFLWSYVNWFNTLSHPSLAPHFLTSSICSWVMSSSWKLQIMSMKFIPWEESLSRRGHSSSRWGSWQGKHHGVSSVLTILTRFNVSREFSSCWGLGF